jgi:hypothetical protein
MTDNDKARVEGGAFSGQISVQNASRGEVQTIQVIYNHAPFNATYTLWFHFTAVAYLNFLTPEAISNNGSPRQKLRTFKKSQ